MRRRQLRLLPRSWNICAEVNLWVGCGLPADAEVPDAELAAIVLFLERCCDAAEEAGAEPVHAIAAVDSEACLVDVEIAWRLGGFRQSSPWTRQRREEVRGICGSAGLAGEWAGWVWGVSL